MKPGERPSEGERDATLAEISKDNLDIVDQLVDEVRRLNEKGQTKEAERLLAIAKKLLHINAKYQLLINPLSPESKSVSK